MARALGVSVTSVHRIWGAFGLQPHRVAMSRTFSTNIRSLDSLKFSVGLYLDPPERALVLCVEREKSDPGARRAAPCRFQLPTRATPASRIKTPRPEFTARKPRLGISGTGS